MRYKTLGVTVVFLGLLFCMGASAFYAKVHQVEIRNSYQNPLRQAPKEENPVANLDKKFMLESDFASHLPIVILDFEGEEPPINMEPNPTTGVFHPIEGVEPYVEGSVTILNQEKNVNYLQDIPQETSKIRIKRRGNSSMRYEKPQYLMKLITKSGQDNDCNLLGMGEEHEWILNGSMADKSMLRNYLAYSISSELMQYTPDSVFCEVVIKEEGQYRYQGVYLLMENIKQGQDRVAISKYQEKETFNSYVIRRDRFDETSIMLDTYARENGFAPEYFGLVYPGKIKATEEMISYVEEDISRIERVIYSNDIELFANYKNLLDIDSFVDYFLINEFFASYDAGNFSTYSYKDKGGKLCMGPVWDYDGTMDNYIFEPLEPEKIAFQTKPWFAQLCKDEWFITQLEERYTKLRRTTLSEQNVFGKIDNVLAHLGGAIDREWYRWKHIYETDNNYSMLPNQTKEGDILIRNDVTHEQTIYRIKTALHQHGYAISDYLKLLHKSTAVTTDMSSKSDIWLLLALAAFLVPAFYVARKS